MKAENVAAALARGPFPYGKYLLVPNTNTFLSWEADLLVVTPNGYLDEIEIKISLHDLRRDAKKNKHRYLREQTLPYPRHPPLRGLYYAMPGEVYEKTKPGDVPDYAGVITVAEGGRCEVVRKPAHNSGARKMTEAEMYRLARLGVIRYWGRHLRDH